jgi:hypothetical protein
LFRFFELPIKVKVESSDFLGEFEPVLLFAMGSVLIDVDISEEPVYDIDELHHVVGDVAFVHLLPNKDVLDVGDNAHLLFRGVFGLLLVL